MITLKLKKNIKIKEKLNTKLSFTVMFWNIRITDSKLPERIKNLFKGTVKEKWKGVWVES